MKATPTPPTCPRLFEAEAARDGRLTGPARAHFEAHAAVCTSCAQEVRALDRLAEALRGSGGGGETDELHVRRERTRLLAAFDASLIPRPRERHAARWLALAAVVAALSVVLWLRVGDVPAPRKAPSGPLVTPPALAKVEAGADAKWTRQTGDGVERIVLESGTLVLRVTHANSSRRLLVVLPDGELEDIGTTFTVTASSGRTTGVSVEEGRVVLRLRDQPPRQLVAGESWSPVAALDPSPPRPTLPRQAAALRHVDVAADAAADFRVALSALNAAESARAAALFSAFLSEHPSDSRAEDAAYLRVIALQRAGRLTEMQSAAATYLNRYPRGFRRAEVEALTKVATP